MCELMDYKIGDVADAFSYNVEKRIKNENFDTKDLEIAVNILSDELFKSLRTLENAIPNK